MEGFTPQCSYLSFMQLIFVFHNLKFTTCLVKTKKEMFLHEWAAINTIYYLYLSKKKKKKFIHISAKKIPFIHIHISVACTPSYCIRKIITFFFFFCWERKIITWSNNSSSLSVFFFSCVRCWIWIFLFS